MNSGDKNLWDPSPRTKRFSWTPMKSDIEFGNARKIISTKLTNSFFTRLLLIARSIRYDIDMKEVIRHYELATSNHTLMVYEDIRPISDKCGDIPTTKVRAA